VVSRVRRGNRERGGEEVRITQKLRDKMRWAKKNGGKAREVVPVVWEWVDRLWKRGKEGDGRVVALMVGLAMRLMLRPGEWGRIRLENVRRVRRGVYVQLVGRKADKVIRRDPWHLVECGGMEWCLACGVWEVVEGRRRGGGEGRGSIVGGSG
jgi:hypothetical protein